MKDENRSYHVLNHGGARVLPYPGRGESAPQAPVNSELAVAECKMWESKYQAVAKRVKMRLAASYSASRDELAQMRRYAMLGAVAAVASVGQCWEDSLPEGLA